MTDHSIIAPSAPSVAPAAVKDFLPLEELLQNDLTNSSIQFKLAIGAPDDPLEHEADAMADKVMRLPEQNFIQRKCSHCKEEEKLQRKPLVSFIQRKESLSDAVASESISSQINSSKGSGGNMDRPTQSFMESRFGTDFSDVKIHTGNDAIQMNRELNAKAFTVGNDIYFNEGQYNPGSNEGKYLLAHELTHTMQQNTTIRRVPKGISGRPLGFVPTPEQEEYDKESYEISEHLFDIMRKGFPGTKGNIYLLGLINKKFKSGTDDFWLAMNLLNNGPEVLWYGTLLTELQAKATKNGWVSAEGTLGASKNAKDVTAFYFPGQTDQRALIIGGVHGSELSGMEVVSILVERLQKGPKPFYTVIIVPRLFPDNAATAEGNPKKIETGENLGRYTDGSEAKHSTDPNRQFPVFGKGYDDVSKKDAKGRIIEVENIMLLELIDRFRPARIASVHSTHSLTDAGIYADPRTNATGKAIGYDTDKKLALDMAEAAKKAGAIISGNKFDKSGKPTNSIYPLDAAPVADGKQQKRETAKGNSLGGWGTTAICDSANPSANRPAMRVITIEVQTARRSTDVGTTKAAARRMELEALATVLQDIFLGSGQSDIVGDPCAP